jgi:hypothetical protein
VSTSRFPTAPSQALSLQLMHSVRGSGSLPVQDHKTFIELRCPRGILSLGPHNWDVGQRYILFRVLRGPEARLSKTPRPSQSYSAPTTSLAWSPLTGVQPRVHLVEYGGPGAHLLGPHDLCGATMPHDILTSDPPPNWGLVNGTSPGWHQCHGAQLLYSSFKV